MSETESLDGILRREFAVQIERGDGRTVDVRVVPFGERIQHNDGLGGVPVGVYYEEEWMPGAFDHQLNAANRILGNFEHQQGLAGMVGKGIALRSVPGDGYHLTLRILDGTDGDKLLQLIPDTIDSVSLEAKPDKSVRTRDGVVQRVKAHLRAVAFTRFGAYQGAKVLAVREEAQIVDHDLLPADDMDEDTILRLRALGVRLPDRYQAHPDDEHPADGGTLAESAPAPTTENTTVEG